MRIAMLADSEWPNFVYRTKLPAHALAQRGHAVHVDVNLDGRKRPDLTAYDAVHVFRLYDADILRRARSLREHGVALVWDNDDELADIHGERKRGAMRSQQAAAGVQAMVELADVVTTTSQVLAVKYRALGAREVQVIENYLPDEAPEVARQSNERIVIGWSACEEHRYDLEQLELRAALRRLLDTHVDVEIASLGLDLGLSDARYRHTKFVEYEHYMERLARFDVGIAPLADSAFNRARSTVKLKEYAAAGLPWLASPIGPYQELGEREGGRLVADARWYDELARLVGDARTRRKLAKRATRWGRTQTMSHNAHRWEQALTSAVAAVAGSRA